MQYNSTRNNNETIEGHQAIIEGLAKDGGLYVPSVFPASIFQEALVNDSYKELAYRILHAFFDTYTEEDLRNCIHLAYTNRFKTKEITPLTINGKYPLLELYHGPTSAFKDVALSILPHLLTSAYRMNHNQETVAILTATSGDTGKAALEGFRDVKNTLIQVFYPSEGVSPTQKRQMQTSLGDNVNVVAISGNFDDCQRVVKQAYQDAFVQSHLHNVILSSANSINIGRLIPQVVYYFDSYLQLVKQGRLHFGDRVNFVVPTGNFGNILAGYYAKQIGLPIHRLICASNENHVLTDFIKTGTYSRNRDFHETMSPSMDILVSSNLERLLYHFANGDGAYIQALYQEFEKSGSFSITPEMKELLDTHFVGYWASEEACAKTIHDAYFIDHILLDPHTAVAYYAAKQYEAEFGSAIPSIVLATASPFKFSKSVLTSLKQNVPEDEEEAMQQLADYTKQEIPQGLAQAFSLPIRFTKTVTKEAANQAIIDFIEGGLHVSD